MHKKIRDVFLCATPVAREKTHAHAGDGSAARRMTIAEKRICIYCKHDDPAKFKGVEHVVPQAFGTFGPQTPTLSCVSDDCNGHFGKNHDIYLARETVEGISRYKQGIFSSAGRP